MSPFLPVDTSVQTDELPNIREEKAVQTEEHDTQQVVPSVFRMDIQLDPSVVETPQESHIQVVEPNIAMIMEVHDQERLPLDEEVITTVLEGGWYIRDNCGNFR